VNLFSALTSNGGLAGVAANGYGGGGGGSGGSVRIAGAKVNLGPSGVVSANGSAGGNATGGGGENAGGGGGGGRVLIQQNAEPLTSGVSANGGAAIGSALAGGDGTIEQPGAGLAVNPAILNVRLGTASTSGFAALGRHLETSGDVYGYVNHFGSGFSSSAIAPNQPFAFTGVISPVQLVDVTYATNSRTTDTITVKSNGGDAILATGRGVGPTFATNMGVHPATTINLGSTGVAHSAAFHLLISNASTDLGVDSPLTALGILDVSITGPDAAAFSVDNLLPALLYEGQYANLPIHFHPTEIRNYLATLTIRTDQGAAIGAPGQTFVYQLGGAGVQAVPEPATLLLGGIMAVGFALRRRRDG
jgi:hypothetical protein